MRGEIQDKENIHSDHEEGSKSADEEEIDVETVTEEQSTIEEEPVSPPPCNPEEAPALLQSLSKTIEVNRRTDYHYFQYSVFLFQH